VVTSVGHHYNHFAWLLPDSNVSGDENDQGKPENTTNQFDKGKETDPFHEIKAQLNSVADSLADVSRHLTSLEENTRPDLANPQNVRMFSLAPNQTTCDSEPVHSYDGVPTESVLSENLRKSVQRIKKVHTSKYRTGVKRDDQRAFNVISKCAQFAETTAKLVTDISPDDVTEQRLNDLY
jgi:hypothetical protein